MIQNDPNPWFSGTSSAESYVDAAAIPEVSYFYFVATDNNQCVEVPLAGEHGMALPNTLKIQNVTVNNTSCSSVSLSWTAETWAATYDIYRNTVNVPPLPGDVEIGTTTDAFFTDDTVDANTQYYYWVTTELDTCGTSLPSETASTFTAIPVITNTTASIGLCDVVEVTWDTIAEQATYHIYRNTFDDPFSAPDEFTWFGSPFIDDTAVADTTYYYWVTAEPTACAGNEGEFGSSANGLSVGVLDTPSNVFASQGSLCGEVLVQWTATNSPESFTIYRSDGANSNWAEAQPLAGGTVYPPSSEYTDFTALSGVTYSYWVVANNDCGGSTTEDVDGVNGFTGQLQNPTAFTATDDLCGIVSLAWDQVDSADLYIVSPIGIGYF